MSLAKILTNIGMQQNSAGNAVFSALIKGALAASSGESQKGFNLYSFKETLADEGQFDLPFTSGSYGMIFVSNGTEMGMFTRSGGNAISLGAGSANMAAANTDTNLCVYNASGTTRVRNRLGSSQEVFCVAIEFES
jgi:hypothetical protein